MVPHESVALVVHAPHALARTTAGSPGDELALAIQHRIAAARDRMMDRLREVNRRVEHVRARLDVAQAIRARPLAACGVAVGAGLLAGLIIGGPRRPAPARAPAPAPARGGTLAGQVARQLAASLGGLALGLVRDQVGAWLARAADDRRGDAD